MVDQAVGVGLAGAAARALEDLPARGAQAVGLGVRLDRLLEVAPGHLARVERERRAVLGHELELGRIDVDRHHARAEGVGDLHRVAADAADADHDRDVAGLDARLRHRLVGRGDRVGHHRDVGELQPGGGEALLIDRAQAARRHHDVGGEAALDVVARHDLGATDRAVSRGAELAGAAGHHRRHDHRAADPLSRRAARTHHPAADLVTERERQRLVGAHAVVVVAEVGVADAAAGDLDHHLVGGQLADLELGADHRPTRLHHHPAIRFGAHLPTPSVYVRVNFDRFDWRLDRVLPVAALDAKLKQAGRRAVDQSQQIDVCVNVNFSTSEASAAKAALRTTQPPVGAVPASPEGTRAWALDRTAPAPAGRRSNIGERG